MMKLVIILIGLLLVSFAAY
ncbi:type I toxin-antitoxin system Ibs family toxin [Escherichia coli]|nr:type I toxin-antitoxin system Ibs family toxin [Escherichia coli]